MKFIVTLLVIAASCGQAMAVTSETADRVLARFAAMPRPSQGATPFARWTYDMALMTAVECWADANPGKEKQVPAALKVSPTMGGSFSIPSRKQAETLCDAVAAHGVAPVCVHATVWVEGEPRSREWPAEYLHISRADAPLKIEGMLTCFLNTGQSGPAHAVYAAQAGPAQHYAGTWSARWVTPPHPDVINTARGARRVMMGTVMVSEPYARTLDGKPYAEPKITIVGE
jgi:hypothetical protein